MPTYRRLASGNWQAGVFHPSGARYYKTDPLKRVVKDWAEDLESQIRRGTFVDPNAGKMTLAEWWVEWSSTRVVALQTASKAETHWRLYVEPAFGSWPLVTIGHMDVLRWIGKLDKQGMSKKPEAFATAVRLLVQLLDAAVVGKKVPLNPAKGLKAPTPPPHVDRVLDLEESDVLLAVVTEGADRLFVQLMLEAGLRWQEVAGQHTFRVDVKRRKQLRVQEVVERGTTEIKPIPKSEAGARVVPLTDELVESITAYLEDHPKDGLLFPAPGGGVWNYSNWLNRVWYPALAKAGLADPQPTPHDCRHSYGTALAEQGVPPHEIAALMGHASLRSVERYIHAGEARMERARSAMRARRAAQKPVKKARKSRGKGA